MNDTSFFFNVSEWASAPAPLEVVTTDVILALCGRWDVQVVFCAVIGLVLSLLTMFYFVRWRKRISTDTFKFFLDKFLLTMIAMLFAIIIVRTLRMG